ncbi:MAG: hypothetical protein JSU01_20475 [Bacteroidetes bacterium]|nr:hypothetical protein [Bacteroidota bacterium]
MHLSGSIANGELLAEIKLADYGSKPISVREITAITSGGLRCFPTTGNIQPVTLQPRKDTLITVKFKPVNDTKIYQLTGKRGPFKNEYTVSVFFKTQSDARMQSLDLNTRLPDNDYKAYLSKYGKPVIGYAFNTGTTFGQTEGDYLEALKPGGQPFAFVAQHELALTGLNIWMTSFCERDSLYAELLVVSQADFAVKIVPDSIDFVDSGHGPSGKSKTVVLEKIAGSKQSPDVIRSGDKVLVRFRKYLKNPKREMVLSIKHAFVLNGPKPLFKDDIQLVEVSLP